MIRRIAAGRLLALLVAATAVWPVAGCRKMPSVGLEIDVPSALQSTIKWIEVGAYAGAQCASLGPLLPGGIPPDGAAARMAFDPSQTSPPLGDLPRQRFAFASTARDANCGVIAIGCTDIDVSASTSVAIALQQVQNGATTCSGGAKCLEARCVPGDDNSDPAEGADCALTYVGSGPLGDPLVDSGTILSAPSIVPTATGFLIGYREYDKFGGQSRVSFFEIDQGGALTAGPQTVLPDRCSGVDGIEGDAMSMAFASPTAGLSVVSRAICGGKPPGLDLLQIDGTGSVSQSGFQPSVSRLLLSPARALAYDPVSKHHIVAFTQDGQAGAAVFDGVQQVKNFTFGGAGTITGAWVAATEDVQAYLALGSGSQGSPTPDAGDPDDDGGDDSGPPPPPPPPTNDAGGGATSLRLQLIGPMDDPGSLATAPPSDSFPASWGSIAATGGRVFVVSDSTGVGRQIAYRVYEGGGTPKTSDGILVEGSGKVAFADTAIDQDNVFFAVEKAAPPTGSTITLFAYANATTTPTFKRRVILSSDPRVPAMGGLRDGLIAVAASDTRVTVVWGTGKTLSDADAVGGYAMFACSTP